MAIARCTAATCRVAGRPVLATVQFPQIGNAIALSAIVARRGRARHQCLGTRRGANAMTSIPASSRYVIVGAGIHGLSTAWHLAKELRARGQSGEDIVVLDKRAIGAGASGIACGVIRNNYFQPAMRELMAHSVSVWESDPEAFAYHPVGYMQIAPEAMHKDVAKIYAEQQAIGYPSVLVEGERDCRAYMLAMFGD